MDQFRKLCPIAVGTIASRAISASSRGQFTSAGQSNASPLARA